MRRNSLLPTSLYTPSYYNVISEVKDEAQENLQSVLKDRAQAMKYKTNNIEKVRERNNYGVHLKCKERREATIQFDLNELSKDSKKLASFKSYQMCDPSTKPRVVQYLGSDNADAENAVNKSTIENEVFKLSQSVLPGGENEGNVLNAFSCTVKTHGVIVGAEDTKSLTDSSRHPLILNQDKQNFNHRQLTGKEPSPVSSTVPIFYVVPHSTQAAAGELLCIDTLMKHLPLGLRLNQGEFYRVPMSKNKRV